MHQNEEIEKDKKSYDAFMTYKRILYKSAGVLLILFSITMMILYFTKSMWESGVRNSLMILSIIVIALLVGIYALSDFSVPGRRNSFDPTKEQKKIERLGCVDLQKAFVYMHTNVGTILLIVFFLFFLGIVITGICLQGPQKKFLYILLIGVSCFALLIALSRFMESKTDYVKRMLCETKKYMPIENDEAFTEQINDELKSNTRYLSKRLILTKNYLIYAGSDEYHFKPVVITTDQIVQLEIYDELTPVSGGSGVQKKMYVLLKNNVRNNVWLGTFFTGREPLEALQYFNLFPIIRIKPKYNP